MDKIEIQILNPGALHHAEKMAAAAARLTQKGHKIKNMEDFLNLYEKGSSYKFLQSLAQLPHPTLQKFAVINIVVVGASRRFLAQITRHQNEVKFMSASLQYSDYSTEADFVVPYEMLDNPRARTLYLESCRDQMDIYQELIGGGVDNDAAGYAAPQGLRNVLIISATPYQWKHMISQRVCRRNTDETRYVMLRIWEELCYLSPALFSNCGPFCMNGECKEGRMTCGRPINKIALPGGILAVDFPLLRPSDFKDPALEDIDNED